MISFVYAVRRADGAIKIGFSRLRLRAIRKKTTIRALLQHGIEMALEQIGEPASP